MNKTIFMIAAVALAGCGDRSLEVVPSSAQAVGPGNISRITVLDGGICAGVGSSGSPFHCELTVDTTTIGGTGVTGSALNVTTKIAEFTYALFGDGSDGAFTFDGSSTFTDHRGTAHAPAANVYTMDDDVFCHGCTVNSGVEIKTGGYRFFDDATLTLNGKITRNGNNAAGRIGGAFQAAGFLGAVRAGGDGSVGAGGCNAGGSSPNAPGNSGLTCSNTGGAAGSPGTNGGACKGGGGGSVGASAGCAAGAVTLNAALTANVRIVHDATVGRASKLTSTALTVGSGGGGARGSTGDGGGGGGAGGHVVVEARLITGSGSVEAKGGTGGNGGTNAGGGGGGGGGFAVVVVGSGSCPTMTVTGGTHGNGNGTGANGGDGGDGLTRCFVLRP